MAHADDATKTWISAIPTKNSDGNVTEWKIKYKYTLAVSGKDDFVKTFEKIFDSMFTFSKLKALVFIIFIQKLMICYLNLPNVFELVRIRRKTTKFAQFR